MTDQTTGAIPQVPETVWECNNRSDAGFLKSVLEDADIPCLVAGANDGLLGLLSARLQVPSSRAQEARALLNMTVGRPYE